MPSLIIENLNDAANAIRRAVSIYRENATEIKAQALPQLLRSFSEYTDAVAAVESARKEISEELRYLEQGVIPERMGEEGVKTTTIETANGTFRMTVGYRFSASMTDKEAGLDWLRENGHGGLIDETVNSKTLSSFAKRLLEDEGKELPDNLFRTGSVPYVSRTKR